MTKCACTWDDLVKWVLPHVSSASDEFKRPSDNMIEAYLRRAAYDFAARTGVLRREVCYDIACGVVDYPILSTNKEDILSYKRVAVNGIVLDSSQYEIRNDILYLEQVPHCDIIDGLCIEYSYAPCTEGVCEVPDDFCTRYREAIISGASSMLLAMPHMDWHSVGASKAFGDDYTDYISRAKVDIRKRRSSRRKTIYDIQTRFIQ